MFVSVRYEGCSSLELEDELVASYQRMCADHARILSIGAELERREAYKDDGARTMSDWLCYRLGIGEGTARDWSASGRSLEFLPAIDEAYSDGLLSWDKVKCLAEFCTPDEDAEWSRDAIGYSASSVRRYALQRRRLSHVAVDARHKRRYLRIVPDVEEGVVRLWGRLSDAEGMAVKRAIGRLADQAPRDPETGRLVPYEQRCADALVAMCSARLGADPDPDRATVVCHTDVATLNAPDAVALADGMPIASDSLRRLLCDGRIQTVLNDADGQTLVIGTTSRVVPPSLRRKVLARDDGCCVWPGCTNTGWLHAHHIVHVVHDGETVEENLVMLCPYHHRLAHEGGWRMRGRPGALVITRPDGRRLEHRAGRVLAEATARAP
jgi:hypothetical protein